MRLAEALHLKLGAIIIFGNNQYTARCTQVWKGKVLGVDPKGSIKVQVIDGKPWIGEECYVKKWGRNVRWVPYLHII